MVDGGVGVDRAGTVRVVAGQHWTDDLHHERVSTASRSVGADRILVFLHQPQCHDGLAAAVRPLHERAVPQRTTESRPRGLHVPLQRGRVDVRCAAVAADDLLLHGGMERDELVGEAKLMFDFPDARDFQDAREGRVHHAVRRRPRGFHETFESV